MSSTVPTTSTPAASGYRTLHRRVATLFTKKSSAENAVTSDIEMNVLLRPPSGRNEQPTSASPKKLIDVRLDENATSRNPNRPLSKADMFAYLIGEQNGIVMREQFQAGLLAAEYHEGTAAAEDVAAAADGTAGDEDDVAAAADDMAGDEEDVAADEAGPLRAYVFDAERMALYNRGLIAGASERQSVQGGQGSVGRAAPRVAEVLANLAVSFLANWSSAEAHYNVHKGDK